jgi:hypothetical protein
MTGDSRATAFTPRRLLESNRTHDLAGQFVLTTEPRNVPDGWPARSIGNWTLASHPGLPITELRSRDGSCLGCLIGFPLDASGGVAAGSVVLDEPSAYGISSDRLESSIYRFGGRFVAVVLSNTIRRVYLDPCGSLPAVYCPSRNIVASTPSLVPYDGETPDHDELIASLGLPGRASMCPLGLTPRIGVLQLLPNHYLDLDDGRSVRHWPTRPIPESSNTAEALARVGSHLRRVLRGLLPFRPHLALTAGRDSRMVLACSREISDGLTCFSVRMPDVSARVDCDVAERICRRVGFKHIVVTPGSPASFPVEEWLFRTGFSVGDLRHWKGASALRRIETDRVDVTGHVGELARAHFWASEAPTAMEIRPERLAALCGAPLDRTTSPFIRAWLDELSGLSPDHVLDLFYIEQRMGCWGGILPYGVAEGIKFQVFPLCQREILETILSLPRPYRWEGTFNVDVIRREWPELLEIPFNTPMGLQRVVSRIDRVRVAATRGLTRVARAAGNPRRTFKRVVDRLR